MVLPSFWKGVNYKKKEFDLLGKDDQQKQGCANACM